MPGQQLPGEILSSGFSAPPPWSPGPLQPFHFRTRREPVDWRRLAALDVDRVAREMDVAVLQEHINGVTFCDVEAERCPHCRGAVDPALLKVLRMSQLSTEYLLHCQDYLSGQLLGLEERLQGMVSKAECEGKERVRLDAELQSVRQESRRRKKMIATQQLLLQAGASNYHKCHCCEKSFINYSYLQAHLQRRHPEVTDAERQKRRQAEQMEDGIEELRERLRLTQSKLEAEREAEALRKQQELEHQKKKEASERQELESWKEEERRKFQQEIGDLKQLLLQEFKDISSQSSAIEAKLQELQAKPVSVSNLGTLRDEDEQEVREGQERGLRQERELRGKIALQKSKWKRRLQDIQSSHQLEKQELQNENERLIMALSSDQKTAVQRLQQQISSLAAQMKRKEKIIQSQEEKIKKMSLRPVGVSASPVIPDEESSEQEDQEELEDSGDRRQKWVDSSLNSSLMPDFRPILEGKLEDRLESMGLRKGTKGISKQTFRSLSSLLAGQRPQKARRLPDLLGLRERLTQEVTHRVCRLQKSQRTWVPAARTSRKDGRTRVSPKLQKSPRARDTAVKASSKKVLSEAPQPAPRSTIALQVPRNRPLRNSTPPFSSEEDSARDAAYITSPRSKSTPLVRVVQSGVKLNLTADTREDWSDTEPSEGPGSPVSNRMPKLQGSVVQSLTRSLERQLSSPSTKPAGGKRVMPPVTASSQRPIAAAQLSDEDSDLELSSIEDVSPQAVVGRTPGARGSADSAGSKGTSVWSSLASRGVGW